MTATVYTLRDSTGAPLYVGCTGDIDKRLAEHRRERDWWPQVATVDLEEHPTREAGLAAEAQLIYALAPIHNVIGKPTGAADYGRLLADSRPPLTDEQVEQAARVFAAEPLEAAA